MGRSHGYAAGGGGGQQRAADTSGLFLLPATRELLSTKELSGSLPDYRQEFGGAAAAGGGRARASPPPMAWRARQEAGMTKGEVSLSSPDGIASLGMGLGLHQPRDAIRSLR